MKRYTVLVEGHCLHTREYIVQTKDEARAKKIAMSLFMKEDKNECDYVDVVDVTEFEVKENEK